MIRLANVTVEIHCKNELEKEEYNRMYYLILSIPLPGGTARYEIPISEPQYKSLIFADKLAKEK